jgi:nucleoside-diphosphate-sugar epimerase
VDFIGQKNTIDAATQAKVEHIVLLGSMGGYRGSKLNDIGRKAGETDPKVGNILKWKRASERYLMKRCFFTIIHAGILTGEKGGEREIVWDTDDSLLR